MNRMKPKRIQRRNVTGPKWQGKGANTGGDKAALSQAKPTCVSSTAQVKPFAGKLFYLDLPSNRIAETLENDITNLGGIVEKFFSKDIRYLVSNKREARYVQCLRQDSPVPSPDTGPSSPYPRTNQHQSGTREDNSKSKSQGQTDSFVQSRGKYLVERVVKEQERVKMNKILSNALEWGVKILYIDDIKAYVQKKKDIVSRLCPATTAVKTSVKVQSEAKQGFQKCKGGRISKPFVKVEDSSRHYRPIYLTMPNMPEFNLKTVPPCSPFCVEDKDPPGNKQPAHRGAKASEERQHGRKKTRDKKRGGYCECCMIKYENVTTHLKSERHKAFSKSDKYLVVDKLVSTLQHCNFLHIKTQVKRPKCSVSSVLIVPGPCGKTVQRHKGDLDTTEEEQHQTLDGHEGSYSGQTLKIRSNAGSAPLINREGERRSYYTLSNRSKHKSIACKRTCRQNSLTSCSQKPEQDPISQPKMETSPSRGERLPSIPSRGTRVNKVAQKITQDMNSPTAYFHNTNVQNEASSKCLDVKTNRQEESDNKQDSLVYEAVEDGNVLPDKMTANNLSEREEASLPTLSFSPVQKIQRRIRVYKRKRQKINTLVERVKPSVIPNGSRLKLWELFQSSDDMDVEFLGFKD
ncbi:protein DBF4 homolog A isoform X2 [Etheostoma spectabile]|uniref:protein DBF4 homolog A isoform X2 n=1 Tax=Etheostoma spectabile TaxID=54343 RepID=UPI0013AF2A79|nr:protein DBF4 homolog A isoform X2 [Etheostoma spectabile]